MSRLKQGMEECRLHETARGRPPRDRRITSLAQCASTRCSRRAIPRAYPADMSRSSRARSAWHTHPLGQTLIVTSGLGWAQAEGGPIEEIRPGDVVWFPPELKHWHGATPTTAMTHIAITEFQNGKNVDLLEKVSDEQYRR